MNLIVRPLFSFLVCTCGVPLIPVVPIASDAWAQVSTRSGGGVASRIISRSTAVVGRVSPTAGALGRSVIGGVRSGASAIGTSTIGVVGVTTSVATTGVSTINDVGQSALGRSAPGRNNRQPDGAIIANSFQKSATCLGLSAFRNWGRYGQQFEQHGFPEPDASAHAAGSLGSGTAGSGSDASTSQGETAESADQSTPLLVAGYGGAWTAAMLRPQQSTPDNPFFGPPPLPSGGSSISAGGRARTLAECEALWDATTHMSKGEWRSSCLRTLSDPHI